MENIQIFTSHIQKLTTDVVQDLKVKIVKSIICITSATYHNSISIIYEYGVI